MYATVSESDPSSQVTVTITMPPVPSPMPRTPRGALYNADDSDDSESSCYSDEMRRSRDDLSMFQSDKQRERGSQRRPRTAPSKTKDSTLTPTNASTPVPSVTTTTSTPITTSTSTNLTQNQMPLPDMRKLDEWLSRHPDFTSTERSNSPSPKSKSPKEGFRNSLTTSLRRLSSISSQRSGGNGRPGSSNGGGSTAGTGTAGIYGNGNASADESRTPSPTTSIYSPRSHIPRPAGRPTHDGTRTQSPNGRRHPFRQLSANPPAMYCHEIHSQRSAAERCAIYAGKINQLYGYDCGLGDWVQTQHLRSTTSSASGAATRSNSNTSGGAGKVKLEARAPTSRPFVPQPRQTSQSSTMSVYSTHSDATFPRRPDASTATDLLDPKSLKAAGELTETLKGDLSAPPPTLPYPSLAYTQPPLATTPRSNSSGSSSPTPHIHPNIASSSLLVGSQNAGTLIVPAPQSKPSGTGGGFFASLGRKASLRTTTSSQAQTIKPSGARSQPEPQRHPSIQLTTQPSIPGGPRPPRRAQRSQTLLVGLASTQGASYSASTPQSANQRSSSRLGGLVGSAKHSGPTRPKNFAFPLATVLHHLNQDPSFATQVDKLLSLVPHVHRTVLAGYLVHAGQDMLAIGQYLEDERMGTVMDFSS